MSSTQIRVSRASVFAARAQVALDKARGIASKPWVLELATLEVDSTSSNAEPNVESTAAPRADGPTSRDQKASEPVDSAETAPGDQTGKSALLVVEALGAGDLTASQVVPIPGFEVTLANIQGEFCRLPFDRQRSIWRKAAFVKFAEDAGSGGDVWVSGVRLRSDPDIGDKGASYSESTPPGGRR